VGDWEAVLKEKDYINATNLAKLRIAKQIIGDVTSAGGTIEKYELADIDERIYLLIERLERKV
jgi:hypothetical protein